MDPATTSGAPAATTATGSGTAPSGRTPTPSPATGPPSGGSGEGAGGEAALDKAKSAVAETAAEVKGQARDLVGEARGQLRGRAEDGTKQLGGTIRSASEELHQMAGASTGGSLATDVTAQLAGGLGHVADRIDEGGMQQVIDDVERYARRHPGRFLLGAVVAGFAVGRLVQHSDTGGLQQAMKDGMTGDDTAGRASGIDLTVGPGTTPSVGSSPGSPLAVGSAGPR